MKTNRFTLFTLFLSLALLLAACSGAAPSATPSPIPATATVTVTATPDPCASENRMVEVQSMHRFMREFDDAYAVALSTSRDQMSSAVSELQRIRREAEDYSAPACLMPLKELQLVQMNTVIQTMLAFMGGADKDTVNQGLALARQLHNQYMLEMSSLLGTTMLAIPTPTLLVGTPAPTERGATATATSSAPIVTNPGPVPVDVLAAPSLESQRLGALAVGQSALALGYSADGFWIMIEIPGQQGQTAWVYAGLVQVNGPGGLPVIVATP